MAAAALFVRRRIRRIDPARAEVEWVIDRESIWFLLNPGRRADSRVGAVPLDRSVRRLRETGAVLVLVAWARRGS